MTDLRGVILGVDPGWEHTGWGVLYACDNGTPMWIAHGVIQTDPALSVAARVDGWVRDFAALVDHRRPVAVAAEAWVFYADQPQTGGINTLRLCGALRAVCQARGIPVLEYEAQALKAAVTASRTATKAEVQRAVQARLRLTAPPRPNHAADALAAALTALDAARLTSSGPQGAAPGTTARKAPPKRRRKHVQ